MYEMPPTAKTRIAIHFYQGPTYNYAPDGLVTASNPGIPTVTTIYAYYARGQGINGYTLLPNMSLYRYDYQRNAVEQVK